MPTRHNYPECSNQYSEFRQSQTNYRSIHERLSYQSNNIDQRIKNEGGHDQLGKRAYDQNWADCDEEKEYVLQDGQWCPGGLTRSQKRRIQRLRNRELEAQKYNRPWTWRVKQTADKGKPSTDINVSFTLPTEYEQRQHKCLLEIVKEGVAKIDDRSQQLIQAVGSEDVS